MRKWLPNIRHLAEVFPLILLLLLFRLMPLDMASAAGGMLGRFVGAMTSRVRVVKRNLGIAFPEMPARERARIAGGVWENLGRMFAEMAFLRGDALFQRVEYVGVEHLNSHKQILFFSAHYGNWELLGGVAQRHEHPIAVVYRGVNNPYADRIINYLRQPHCEYMIAKGHKNAALFLRTIKKGLSIGLLADQKMNTGIAVPFFGHPAMTTSAVAQMALRFNLPLVPARVERTRGAHFKATIYPPLPLEKTGNEEQDIYNALLAMNQMIEQWVREKPEQWFWVHNRWPVR